MVKKNKRKEGLTQEEKDKLLNKINKIQTKYFDNNFAEPIVNVPYIIQEAIEAVKERLFGDLLRLGLITKEEIDIIIKENSSKLNKDKKINSLSWVDEALSKIMKDINNLKELIINTPLIQ